MFKILIFLTLIYPRITFGGPSGQLLFEEISGEIVTALWVAESSNTYAKIPLKGERFDIDSQKLESILVMLLTNVKGISNLHKERLNSEFKIWLFQSPLKFQISKENEKKMKDNNDILLFVCVLSKEKVKQLTIGDQVTITNVKYFADDFGGHATYENMKNEKPK